MSVEIVSENKSHGGRQLVVKHPSAATSTDMTFSIFLPPQAETPLIWTAQVLSPMSENC